VRRRHHRRSLCRGEAERVAPRPPYLAANHRGKGATVNRLKRVPGAHGIGRKSPPVTLAMAQRADDANERERTLARSQLNLKTAREAPCGSRAVTGVIFRMSRNNQAAEELYKEQECSMTPSRHRPSSSRLEHTRETRMKALVTALFLGGLVTAVFLVCREADDGGQLRPAATHAIHTLLRHLGTASHPLH